MKTTALSEASVYVGTYGKYNNGSLFGAWLDLSDYADKAVRRMAGLVGLCG